MQDIEHLDYQFGPGLGETSLAHFPVTSHRFQFLGVSPPDRLMSLVGKKCLAYTLHRSHLSSRYGTVRHSSRSGLSFFRLVSFFTSSSLMDLSTHLGLSEPQQRARQLFLRPFSQTKRLATCSPNMCWTKRLLCLPISDKVDSMLCPLPNADNNNTLTRETIKCSSVFFF